MDLGDSIEFDHSSHCASSEAIPMIKITCLSNIWLPSHLFQNQKKFIDTNVNKRGILHTLEKPVITDQFSIYSLNAQNDDHENRLFPDDDFSDDFSHDMLDLLNAHSPTVSLKDSIEDIYHSGDDEEIEENARLLEETYNCIDFKSISDHSSNILSQQSENIEIERQFNGIATENEHFQTGITECSNQIHVGKLLDSCIEDLTEYPSAYQSSAIDEQRQDPDFDCTSNILLQQSEKIEIESQSNEINPEIEHFQTGSACSNHMDMGEPLDSHIEDLIQYSIAYQRPAVEEAVGKQKEKKKKKAQKKKKFNVFVPEDNYVSDYNEPFVDEFYEQVMRKERNELYPPSYASEYPSLHKESQVNHYGSERMYSSEQKTLQKVAERHSKMNTIDITDQTISTVSKEMEINEEPDITDGTTIVIENIPLEVTNEQIYSLLLGYGEIEKFSREFCGKKAEVRLIGELDWIIECLNGNQPFGTTSEVLKCYKLC